jgi:hypothetical protein
MNWICKTHGDSNQVEPCCLKAKMNLDPTIKRLLYYWENTIKDYKEKEANKEHPASHWRSDHEFGMLLGIRSTAKIFLGTDHEIPIAMDAEITELIKR